MAKHTQTIRRQFAAYRVKYALFIRRGNKVLIRKIKIISGCNTDLVKRARLTTFLKLTKASF